MNKIKIEMTVRSGGHPDGNPMQVTLPAHANYNYRARARKALRKISSRCYWCGIEVVEQRYLSGSSCPYSATIDHIVSRYYRNLDEPCEVVLSCFKCNNDRSAKETAELSIAERRERCSRHSSCS